MRACLRVVIHIPGKTWNQETRNQKHFLFYLKILTTDEDHVFDLKYVRHTPKLYKCSDIDTKQDDVMSDGTFKLSIGRINCVIISKIMYDLQVCVRMCGCMYACVPKSRER